LGPIYSDQEYKQHLHFNSDNWTREETDYLMEQCQQYEFKFIVIHDRWNYKNGPARKIEDIKARYYYIREVLESIHNSGKDLVEKSVPFNKEQEILRKKQIEILNIRPSSTQKEEESLLPRYSNLMTAFKDHKPDSNKIIKLAQKALVTKKRKSKLTPGKTGLSKDLALKVTKYNIAIQAALLELGIQKPNASDLSAMQKYNEIRSEICILFELQRIQSESLYELQVLKGHQAILTNSDIPIVSVDSFLPSATEFSLMPTTFGANEEPFFGDMDDSIADSEEIVITKKNKRKISYQPKKRRGSFKDDDDEESEIFSSEEESEEFLGDDESGD